MRSIKKLLFVTSIFFFLSGSTLFYYAPTGNITLSLKNIDGTSTPLPGANGRVILHNSSYTPLSTKYK
jgi:hypothetical protein